MLLGFLKRFLFLILSKRLGRFSGILRDSWGFFQILGDSQKSLEDFPGFFLRFSRILWDSLGFFEILWDSWVFLKES